MSVNSQCIPESCYKVKDNNKQYNEISEDGQSSCVGLFEKLSLINSPTDLKKMSLKELPQVTKEIRELIIETVNKCGGHLASSLGATELAVALHYVYNTPEDKLVWDVGHQAYAHKILTGRINAFSQIRQFGGISGFPRISESNYDALSVGHASTSISAGLGMAIARDYKKEKHKVVTIIGDGSFTGGMAYEALNHLGERSTQLTVILNDNQMSISNSVGAIAKYLIKSIDDPRMQKLKDRIHKTITNFPLIGPSTSSLIHELKKNLLEKGMIGSFFEDLGLRYYGPVDGNNISETISALKEIRETMNGPVLLHLLTKKGLGHELAEKNPTKFHGVGKTVKKKSGISNYENISYSEVFGKTIVELAEKRTDVIAITAAMTDGTGLTEFNNKFPSRIHDVGIAEEHCVTFAAGLALGGMKPIVALYSTFLQRSYDQIVHDVALDSLNVVFCIDRAGLVEDGATHHGVLDLSFLRTIPNVTVLAPANGDELRMMMHYAVYRHNGPIFIRYPRGNTKMNATSYGDNCIKPNIIHRGEKIALISVGHCLEIACAAAEIIYKKLDIYPTIINARTVKPLDENFYSEITKDHAICATVEPNSIVGGFGSAMLEFVNKKSLSSEIIKFGYPDKFVTHGKTEQLHDLLGFTPEKISEEIIDRFLTNKVDKKNNKENYKHHYSL